MGGQRSPKHTGKIHLTPQDPVFSQALMVPELVNGWIHLKPTVLQEIKTRLLKKFRDQQAAAKHFGISQATMSERLNGRKGFVGPDLADVLQKIRLGFSPDMVKELILRNHVEPLHNIILELTAVSIYANGVGMPATRNLLDIGHAFLHKILHKYEQMGLVHVRSKSAGVKQAGDYAQYTSTEVPELYVSTFVQNYDLTMDQAKLLIATLLLTDGGVRQDIKKYTHSRRQYPRYHIEFFGRSSILHQIFIDLMFHAFQVKPSSYLRRRQDGLFISGYTGIKAEKPVEELLKLSPSYKTKPYKTPTLQYIFEEPHPTLQHVLEADAKTKILAFRLGMSCEGSVSLVSGPDEYIVRPELKFGCAHPSLAIQWAQLARDLGIPFNLLKAYGHTATILDSPQKIIENVIAFVRKNNESQTWSGIVGLQSGQVDSSLRFETMGGFIPGVEVAGYSRFDGCTKNQVLKALLCYRQDINSGEIPQTPQSFTREFKTQEVLKRAKHFGMC